MLRAAIDTNGLYTSRAGVARYIRGLLTGLRTISELEIIRHAWKVENFEHRQPRRSWRTFYREIIWANFISPGLLRKSGAQIYHATSGLYHPRLAELKCVVTLHDLAVLRHPERFRRWHLSSAKRQLARLASSDRIICISRFTADEAIALLGLSAAKLEVVYNGCDFSTGAGPEELLPAFKVPDEFFLFVGSLEPGKNLALLKQTYALARIQGIMLPPLLIVGARWSGVPGEGAPPSDWHYLGHQSDQVLVYLYRRARALAFPSKYEGFGLPVVEAMALGCPVICSKVASLPEVGGDAPCYAELTASDYLRAFCDLLADSNAREDCIREGRRQASRFTWNRCALETSGVYQGVKP